MTVPTPPKISRRLITFVLALTFAFAVGASAAQNAKPSGASRPSSQPTTKPAPLSSPRTTIQQFLLAVDEAKTKPERIKDAVVCLDLSLLPQDERAEQGPKRAAALATILERSTIPPLETVPKDSEEDEYEYLTVAEHRITLARGEDGLWRFSGESVKKIPIILQVISKTAATQEAPKETQQIPAGFRSARATMSTFLKATQAEDFLTAVQCLDLSQVSDAIRADVGKQRVIRLQEILDRIRKVIVTDIPDEPKGQAYVWYVDPTHGRIELARREEGERTGHWFFSKDTVNAIDDWFKAIQDLDKVEGVGERSFWASPAMWIRGKIPSALKREGSTIEPWQGLGVMLVLIISMVIHRLVSWFLDTYVRHWLEKQHVRVDEKVRSASLRPFGIFAMVWFWWGGIRLLDFDLNVQEILTPSIKFVVIVVGIWAIYRLVDLARGYGERLAARTESKLDDLLVPMAGKALKVVIALVGFFLVASTFGEEKTITRMLTGLGLGGLAFALAAQDTIKNFFGSLTIILDRPFQVGDSVVIGEVQGTIEGIGFRSTKVRTFYNSLVTVPNSVLMNSTLDNYGRRSYRRIKRMISVTYSTDPELLEAFCEGIRELIRRHPYTRKDYFQVYVNVLEASSIDILLYCFLETQDWSIELHERHRLFLDIIRLAKSLGVEFAFPTQTIHLDKGEAASPSAPLPANAEQAQAEGRKHAAAIVTSAVGTGGQETASGSDATAAS